MFIPIDANRIDLCMQWSVEDAAHELITQKSPQGSDDMLHGGSLILT